MSRQRSRALQALDGATVDVAIIGGGINGAVSAAALSAAGVSVALLDKGDFSSFTSQESSNLVWGGFKYLQSYEFGLVRKLCMSRNRLIDAYPTQVQPIEFLATFDASSPYPAWFAGLGAAAYWAIGNFKTERPQVLRSSAIEKLEPVINTENARGGLIYADAYLPDNDARFTFGFVKRAMDRGALAANYTEVVDPHFDGRQWTLGLRDSLDNSMRTMHARTIVNATGPVIDRVNRDLDVTTVHRIAFSKGIHLIVPRIGSGTRVFAFFDEDDRLYYVIPMGNRSVIGTTDTRVDDPATKATPDDRAFVLRQINSRLDLPTPLTEADVIAERSGVRPLVVEADNAHEDDDWLQLSRKHEIELDRDRGVVSVFGGKLTDCLNVGEEVLDAVRELGVSAPQLDDSWFGEPSVGEFARFEAFALHHGLDSDDAALLWRRYGSGAQAVVDRIGADAEMAEVVWTEPKLWRAEVVEIGESEMICQLEDFLRRRTGLALTADQQKLATHHELFRYLLGLEPVSSL